MSAIKFLYIERQKILRQTIAHLIKYVTDIVLVGAVDEAEKLVYPQQHGYPGADVLLVGAPVVDFRPYASSVNLLSTVGSIREKFPDAKLVVTCPVESKSLIVRLLEAGVRGIVSKFTPFDELCSSIRTVAEGRHYVCSNISEELSGNNRQELPGDYDIHIFSFREKQVLYLMAQGYTSAEIGDYLFISPKTVESHRKKLVTKAGVRNSTALVAFAYTHGIL